jgi:hypothetical protein
MSDAHQGRPKDDNGSDGTNDNLSNIIVDDDELPSAAATEVVAEASEEDGPSASKTPTLTTTPNASAGEEDPVVDNCAAATQQEVNGVANAQENGVGGSSGNSGANALASILGRIVAENTSAKIMASQAFIQPLSMAATALQYNTNRAVCTTAVVTNRICNPDINVIGTLLNSLDGVLQTTNWLKGLALQYLASVGGVGGGVGGGIADLPPMQPAQYYWGGGGNNANDDANNEEQPEIIDSMSMPPSQVQQIVNRHKRRRLDAATIFAPKFMKSINTQNIDKMEWKDSTTKRREGTVRQDAMDIRAALMAISRGNPARASEALVRFLDSKDTNDDIRRTVKAHLNDVDHQIVQGLKSSIAHHTNSKGGTRSLAAETFVKDVVTASVWHIVAASAASSKEHKIAMGPIVDALGTNRNQLQHGIDRAHTLIDTNKQVEKYKREERKDKGFKKGKMIKNAPLLDPRLLLQQQQEDNDFLHFSTNTEYNNLDDDNGL